LVAAVTGDCDVVNGYKIERFDPLHRVVIGRLYHHIVRLLFGFRLRDVDCDFRLMRRAVFDKITLTSTSGTICLEMVKKLQIKDFTSRRSRSTITIAPTASPSSSIFRASLKQPNSSWDCGGIWL